jgi:outer membrane protein
MEYPMRFNSSLIKPVLGAAILSACGVSFAQKAGDLIGYAGVASINPSASIGSLSSVGPAAATFGPVTAGATASIGKTNTTTLSALYMFTDNVGAEFTIGVPPTMTVDVQLTSGAHPGAATAKALFPSAVAKYLFNSPSDSVRPYLGLGITSTSFSSASANANDALVVKLAGTSVALSSSWNPVYSAGAVVHINDRWSMNGSVSYVPMKSNSTFVGTGTTTTGTLTINPTEYVLRVGYKF